MRPADFEHLLRDSSEAEPEQARRNERVLGRAGLRDGRVLAGMKVQKFSQGGMRGEPRLSYNKKIKKCLRRLEVGAYRRAK